MKIFVALFAVVAVAVANPLPLVQLIVNVDAPAGYNPITIDGPVNPSPVIEKPEPVVPGPVNIVDNVDVEPIFVPEPVVLPAPVLPEVVIPEPVVLPAPVLPEVIIPQPVVLPEPVIPEVVAPEEVIVEVPASVPIGVVNPAEAITPEEVIITAPVVAPSVINH